VHRSESTQLNNSDISLTCKKATEIGKKYWRERGRKCDKYYWKFRKRIKANSIANG
jgi:hypothetical protein